MKPAYLKYVPYLGARGMTSAKCKLRDVADTVASLLAPGPLSPALEELKHKALIAFVRMADDEQITVSC
jgi:hypothetical protein